MTRKFLVTKFVCAKCGCNLSLSYDAPTTNISYEDGEPTGADMVQQLIVVEPCVPCMAPLRRLQTALSILKDNT